MKINNTYQNHIILQKRMQEIVFLTEIKQINWDDILQCQQNDTNHSFNPFNDTIEKLLDKHMPKRIITKK